jgi:4-aminobutyrate aminotransferase / (S)-3-amino-2-methylpropionate transaminase / 5-aminovalerate transaminase
MTKSEALFARRKAVVSNGVSIFAPTTIEQAHGAHMTDVNGVEWIDFAGGIGVVTAGHCPEPVVQAITTQAQRLLHANFNVSTYELYIEVCEKLVELFPHGSDQTKVMLTNTGAESVENAIKIARQATHRPAVICYSEGFHGRSMMAMTLTSKVSYKRNCGPFAPEVYKIQYPSYFHYGQGLTEAEFVARELEQLEYTFKSTVPADHVAAIIIEPIQGEGGFNAAPFEYLKGLRTICDKHGIMLIFDEVQSGFCRTGKWAAYDHAGVYPDLSTWAKAIASGMPLGCVIGKGHVMDAAEPGTIGGTYPGNPVACAAALATIQYMIDHKLNERAEALGHVMRQRLNALKTWCPAVVDVRGLGAMIAVEFMHPEDHTKPAAALVDAFLKKAWEDKLLIIPAGLYRNIIRILVPLVVTDEELDKGLTRFETALKAVYTPALLPA